MYFLLGHCLWGCDISILVQAVMMGQTCQSAEWFSKLDKSFGSCVGEVIELAEELPCHSEVQMLEKCIEVMCEDSQKPVLFLEIATVLSHEGITALSTKVYYLCVFIFQPSQVHGFYFIA